MANSREDSLYAPNSNDNPAYISNILRVLLRANDTQWVLKLLERE